MTVQNMGIEYFGIETDIKDDDKIFELRYRYATKGDGYDPAAGYAAFGRFIDLLADIYREGFVAEMTPARKYRLSQQMGLSVEDLDEFLDTCVDVGLFDRGFWEKDNALTSRGIQRRYYIVASRRRGTIPENQRRYLLIDDAPGADESDSPTQDATTLRQVDATLQQPDSTTMQVTESCVTREEKRREEKRTKEKKSEDEEKGASASLDAITSSLSKKFSSRSSKDGKEPHIQTYPLSCFSQSGGNRLYDDGSGGNHESAWDALVVYLRNNFPDIDTASFAAKVYATCPKDCSETPECVSQCFALIRGALDKFDKSKCKSPIPLVCKVLKEDRGDAQ